MPWLGQPLAETWHDTTRDVIESVRATAAGGEAVTIGVRLVSVGTPRHCGARPGRQHEHLTDFQVEPMNTQEPVAAEHPAQPPAIPPYDARDHPPEGWQSG